MENNTRSFLVRSTEGYVVRLYLLGGEKMKKILSLCIIGVFALMVGCATEQKPAPVAKGYVPADPFPPLPVDAKAYVAVGKAIFKKDKQTAEDMARITALGILTDNFSLDAVRAIQEEVKDASTDGEGKRVYNILSRIKYDGPIPGQKFNEKIVSEKTGEVLIRIYVARPEVDEIIMPYYLKKLRDIAAGDYADQIEKKYLEIYTSKEFEKDKENQLKILREYNYQVQLNLMKRI